MSEHPFDATAAGYDAEFTQTQLGQWLRQAVQAQLAAAFAPGDTVLELGCGTGEDAIWLAQRGVQVTATDASPGMLEVASRKATAAGVADRVAFLHLDLAAQQFDSIPVTVRPLQEGGRPHAGPTLQAGGMMVPGNPYDGAFSNFGPLNCVPDRRALAAALAKWIRPGGRLVLVLMGPWCPWEMGWYLLHGQPSMAFRRLRNGVVADLGHGETIQVWYPSPRQLVAEFQPGFTLERLLGVGAVLPPTYLHHLADRWPGAMGRLARLDRQVGRLWPWTWLNDHYLVVLTRR